MPVSAPLSSSTGRTVRLCSSVRRAMSSASSSMTTLALRRRTLDWLSTSLLNGMSRETLKAILGCDLAMESTPRRAGRERLSRPLQARHGDSRPTLPL
jgi:hypothetical protein